MRVFAMGFTKNSILVLENLKDLLEARGHEVSLYLSPRIFEDLSGQAGSRGNFEGASLADFTKEAWDQGDALVYVGATGIAVRALASYFVRKDQDPAVLVLDEGANYVIPLLSGHIGGGNALASQLAEGLGALAVITTATDLNQKLAIDSWATEKAYGIEPIGNIAQISSAVLEDREILLLAPEGDCQELGSLYSNFRPRSLTLDYQVDQELIARELEDWTGPVVLISPYEGPLDRGSSRLQLIPPFFFAGMGARKNADPGLVKEFFLEALKEYGIHPKSLASISSIDIKSEEEAIIECSKWISGGRRRSLASRLNFFKARELEIAENYIDHVFAQSDLVRSVTGLDNVCERAAVLGAVKFMAQKGIKLKDRQILLDMKKTKGAGATLAIAHISNS